MDHLDTAISVFETDDAVGIQVPRALVAAAVTYFRDREVDLGEPIRLEPQRDDSLSGEQLLRLPALLGTGDHDAQMMQLQAVANGFRDYIEKEGGRGAL
jgi:hypothetical protein